MIEIVHLLISERSNRVSVKWLLIYWKGNEVYLVLTVFPAKVTTVFDFNFFKSRNCFGGIRRFSKIMDLHEELTAAWTSENLVTVMGQLWRVTFVVLLYAGTALAPRIKINDFIVLLRRKKNVTMDRPGRSLNTRHGNDSHPRISSHARPNDIMI